MDLTQLKCAPCEGIGRPMTAKEAKEYLKKVKDWKINGKMIEKKFKFKDFMAAINFINKVASIAEEEGHHPDIHLTGWNKVKFELTTHELGGLTQNDFILAAKIDKLMPQ